MAVAEKLATPTDLARSSARLLDDAAKGPVSIARGRAKPDITLIARDEWQAAEYSRRWLGAFSTIVRYAIERLADNTEQSVPIEFEWLQALDHDELAEFMSDFSRAMKDAVSGARSWEEVDNVLHEWHRSAIVLQDQSLMSRLKQAKGTLE